MFDYEGALAREEGILARNDAGELIRVERITEDDLYERVIISVDGFDTVVPLALPMLDELGTPRRGTDGRYLPRQTTLYDAISIRYHRTKCPNTLYPIPAPGQRIEPVPTDYNPVPILCHQHHLRPVGLCRVCSVKVVGKSGPSDRLAASCITPVTRDSHNIKIYTPCDKDTPFEERNPTRAEVGKHVGMLLTLLAANHLHTYDAPPMVPIPKFRNELLELCERFGVVQPPPGPAGYTAPTGPDCRIPLPTATSLGLELAHRHLLPVAEVSIPNGWDKLPVFDTSSAIITVDRNDCILCDRCVRACSEVKPFKVIGHTGFGKVAGITFGLNLPMVSRPEADDSGLQNPSGCVSCGECATACPTGALEFQKQVYHYSSTTPRGSEDFGFQFNPAFTHQQPPQFIDFKTVAPRSQSEIRPNTREVGLPELDPTSHRSGAPDGLTGAIPQPVLDLFHTIPRAYLWWTEGAVHELIINETPVILCRQWESGSVAFILCAGKISVYAAESQQQISERKDTINVDNSNNDGSGGRVTEATGAATEQVAPHPRVVILGEMACMTHQLRTATLIAHPGAKLWVVRRNMLHVLQRSWSGHDLLTDWYRRRAIQIFYARGTLFEGLSKPVSEAGIQFLRDYPGETLSRPLPPPPDSSELGKIVADWEEPKRSKERDRVNAVLTGLRSWVLSGTPPGRASTWLDPLANVRGASEILTRLRTARQKYDEACAHNRKHSIELLQYRPAEVIVRQGDVADSLFIVYMGHVQVSTIDTNIYPHQSQIVGDHGPSGHFGETALLSELFPGITAEFDVRPGRRTATVTALDHVEVVRIGFEVFRSLLNAQPEIYTFLEARAIAWLRQNPAVRPAVAELHRQFLTGQGLYQGQDLLVIDLNKCTRCNECVKACAAAHKDGVSRLILEGNRFDSFLVPSACRSCQDPGCLHGCPVDAIHRGTHNQGTDRHSIAQNLAIRIDDHCIGCGLCAHNCPFGSIHMVPSGAVAGSLGKALVSREQDRVATNCDLCATLDGTARCVRHCPHDAAMRFPATELALLVGVPTGGK